jgi:ArsR family transcriptional regulator, arsenate/arsenite/antimonite-responsive transcriptional repressor
MEKELKLKYSVRAKIIKAMAHPSRLLILDELAKSERCVCELVEMIGDDPSTVSKHLSVLKNAGLIEDEKRGMKVFYNLKCRCLGQYFDCIEKSIAQQSKHLARVANL